MPAAKCKGQIPGVYADRWKWSDSSQILQFQVDGCSALSMVPIDSPMGIVL